MLVSHPSLQLSPEHARCAVCSVSPFMRHQCPCLSWGPMACRGARPCAPGLVFSPQSRACRSLWARAGPSSSSMRRGRLCGGGHAGSNAYDHGSIAGWFQSRWHRLNVSARWMLCFVGSSRAFVGHSRDFELGLCLAARTLRCILSCDATQCELHCVDGCLELPRTC